MSFTLLFVVISIGEVHSLVERTSDRDGIDRLQCLQREEQSINGVHMLRTALKEPNTSSPMEVFIQPPKSAKKSYKLPMLLPMVCIILNLPI